MYNFKKQVCQFKSFQNSTPLLNKLLKVSVVVMFQKKYQKATKKNEM